MGPRPVERSTGPGRTIARFVIGGLTAVAVLAATGVIAYRVFVAHDYLTRPTVPYPAAVVITNERPFSELTNAPLVVEGRLRVYAEGRRVWADGPVGVQYETTPYWSFRRWPAQVVGLVSVGTADGPLVLSQWSDGQIIAINARTGTITWRITAPTANRGYDGRRTGASTVYAPRSLLTARVGDQTMLVVTSPGQVQAYDSATGAAAWTRASAGGCEPMAWTGAGLVVIPSCLGASAAVVDALTGAGRLWTPPTADPRQTVSPDLCALGRSECRLVTVGARAWLLRSSGQLTAVPSLEPGSVLAGDRVVYPTATGVAARRLSDGTPLWSWQGKGRLIAADSVGVYLLTDDHTVLALSPVTGRLTVLGCAAAKPDEDWRLGYIHPTDGNYLVLERVTSAPSTAKDSVYYYGPRPIALVELYPPTKLPVWAGKFAACVPADEAGQ